MLSGLILIAISQGIGGVCYCLGKYSVNRAEKKVLFDLSVPSDKLYDNRVNSVLVGKRQQNKYKQNKKAVAY